MVELTTGTAIAAAGGGVGLGALLALLLIRSFRRGRATARRLSSIAARLEAPGVAEAPDRDEVGSLERLAQAAVLRQSDADARAERLAGALDGVRDGVVVCDEQGEVAYRNEAAEALAGAGSEAGTELAASAVRDALRAALAGGGGPAAVRTVEVLGPPRRTLRVRGSSLDDGRRVVGAVAVVEDVSEQRRLDVVRRDFLANVTAELKTPVGALGLLAGTIVAEDDPALTRRLAARLERDALAVGRVVDDLSELSRLEGEAVPPRDPVPVHVLVAQAVEDARAAVPDRAVAIDAGGVPDGLAVPGDRRQLVSALRRLVENALKYSSGEVRVDVAGAHGWAEIAVTDAGAGIPPGDLDRVFEAFFRGGPGRAPSTAGTGLGLAIVARVAGSHGGRVLVSSDEGKGSTFTLRLPAAGAPPARAAREAG
ncbi:MAG: sensor histidine kinase [Actinomycetota bacterium]